MFKNREKVKSGGKKKKKERKGEKKNKPNQDLRKFRVYSVKMLLS